MSENIKLTEEHYKALCAAVTEKHDVRIIDKDNAAEMKVLGDLFDKAREYAKMIGQDILISGDEWKDRFAVTLAERIYIPGHWSPFSKILVLIHELQHALQWQARQPQSDLPSDVSFAWLYLTWGDARVRFEVEAYRAGQLEFRKFLTGTVTPLNEMVRPLEGPAYALSGPDAGLTLSRRLLAIAGTAVSAGVAPSTAAARSGVEIVRKLFPELEGAVTA